MLWIEAVALASPRPAMRRDGDGVTWIVYLDGSVDRLDARGWLRRMPRADAGAWVDWAPEETRSKSLGWNR